MEPHEKRQKTATTSHVRPLPKPQTYPDGSVYYGQPQKPEVVADRVLVAPQHYGKYCCGGEKTHESVGKGWQVHGLAERVQLCNGCKRLLKEPTPAEWLKSEGWTDAEIAAFASECEQDKDCRLAPM